jgi:hypothetical protein
MATWSTLHIFGYGETQIISDNVNFKTATSNLLAAQPVVDDVYSHKPVDSDASASYHAVNIFNGMFADFQPNIGAGFRVQYAELNEILIDALVEEIVALIPPPTTSTTTSTTTLA